MKYEPMDLFDLPDHLRRLSATDDPLEVLERVVDSTLVSAPRQRVDAQEREAIRVVRRASEIGSDQPAKAAQKDTDACLDGEDRSAQAAGPDDAMLADDYDPDLRLQEPHRDGSNLWLHPPLGGDRCRLL